jgi:hypothetical protein
MRMLALLTGFTVATVLTGMVLANRTASETSVALADQNGACVDCAIRQPIKDSDIPQEPRDDGCSGCANRQPTKPTILTERAEVTPTVELADGISNCTACATEKPDGLGVPITPAAPPVKVTEHTGGCANCIEERSRRQAPQHQSGGLKQRQAPQGYSSQPTRSRHAARRGPRQQPAPSEDFPSSVEIRRSFIDAHIIANWDE